MKTAITPVEFSTTANALRITPQSFGPPPAFRVEHLSVTGEPDAVKQYLASDETKRGPRRSQPAGVTVAVLKSQTVTMTQDQWDAWDNQSDDDTYIRGCVIANLSTKP